MHCLAADLRVDTIRDAANHVPWLNMHTADLLASGHVLVCQCLATRFSLLA